jgi:small subunit ribosomal protein S1
VQSGDYVSVAIDARKRLRRHHPVARQGQAPGIVADAGKGLDDGELVTGTITGKVKGGLTVMVNGIRAFLPGSLVDMRPVKDTPRTKARPSNSASSSSTASATTSCCRVAP